MTMLAYQKASKSYAAMDLESSINSASPHKLILMLYEGAIQALQRAKTFIHKKQITAKGKEISHAISIIDEGLSACLNYDHGGEVAKNLSNLYGYMSYRLIQANLHNNIEFLDEVIVLLGDLRGAWEQIGTDTGGIATSGATTKEANTAAEELALDTLDSESNTTGAEATASISYGKV